MVRLLVFIQSVIKAARRAIASPAQLLSFTLDIFFSSERPSVTSI